MTKKPNKLNDAELEQVKGGVVAPKPTAGSPRRVRKPTDQTNGIFSDMDFTDSTV